MNDFTVDLTVLNQEPVHTLSQEELDSLQASYNKLKALVDSGTYELTLEDQRTILQWRRADRETKFILQKAKPVKEKVVRVKKPKKLSNKAMGLLYLKEIKGEELTEEEKRNKHFTETREII